MSSRLDAFAPFSARLQSLAHVVTNTCNRSLFFAPKLWEPRVPLLTAASACFGVYYGTFASLFPAVMSDGFGRRHVGVLTGFSFALGSVPSALGPVAMGWVADETGRYILAFLGGTVVNSLAVLLFTLARPPVRSA